MKLKSPQTEPEIRDAQIPGTDPKNILIIRSASRTFPKALAALKQEFPNARFTVLTENPETLKGSVDIESVLALPPGKRISWFSFGPGKRAELARQQFDLAVVLYNVPEGRGYANVETLAWCSGAREIRGYFPDGGFRPLPGAAIFRNFAKEQTAFGWVVINFIMTVALLLVFTVIMAGEALLRLFKKPITRHRPDSTKTS